MDIDFVILWVDGNDPGWQAEKSRYQSKKEDDSNTVNRYRDWNLLPYWFRAVENFASLGKKNPFCDMGTCTKIFADEELKIAYCKA